MEKFNQLCVWPATTCGNKPEEIKAFENFIANNFNGVRVKYEAEVTTLPDKINGEDVPGTGGRNDLFFYVHDDDIGKFAIARLAVGIRWWEDVLGNGNAYLYSEEFLKKHPKTW